MKATVIPVVMGVLEAIPKRLGKKSGRFGKQRLSRNHPDYSIIKTGQNTEKSPEDLRRLAPTQTPVKNPQLTPVRKFLKK